MTSYWNYHRLIHKTVLNFKKLYSKRFLLPWTVPKVKKIHEKLHSRLFFKTLPLNTKKFWKSETWVLFSNTWLRKVLWNQKRKVFLEIITWYHKWTSTKHFGTSLGILVVKIFFLATPNLADHTKLLVQNWYFHKNSTFLLLYARGFLLSSRAAKTTITACKVSKYGVFTFHCMISPFWLFPKKTFNFRDVGAFHELSGRYCTRLSHIDWRYVWAVITSKFYLNFILVKIIVRWSLTLY